jgi:signal transduction histidine kinase/ligand-binding sensor domain-containing protein
MRSKHKGRKRVVAKALWTAGVCVFVVVAASEVEALRDDSAALRASGFHQWGAITLFHGLPSDHVRVIAQAADGTMWFGTDSGLVKYDGRRIQRIATDGWVAGQIRALEIDADGALWIGTNSGAARLIKGEIKPIADTEGIAVTAIITPSPRRTIMTSEQGNVFYASLREDDSVAVQKITPENNPLLQIESRAGAPVQLTTLALVNGSLIVGTRSRGLLELSPDASAHDRIKEIISRPRAFFVNAIVTDARGQLWFGAETSPSDSGLFASPNLLHPAKVGAGTGTVTALKFNARGELWAGTDGNGVFRFRDSKRLDHFTFENTAGGLRSNHIYSVFVDREGVVWFGTDRGVSRYDPQGLRVEMISQNAWSNFARSLFRSTDGTLWCGTNRGLFARENEASGWREITQLAGKTVHAISEDPQGRVLVGTASGLFTGSKSPNRHAAGGGRQFARVDGGDNIRAIREFQGASYVASFGRGVERFDDQQLTVVWPPETADAGQREVTSLHGEGGRLWIGTAEAGVFSFDGKQASTNPDLGQLRGSAVWAITGTSDKALWFATSAGLYALKAGALRPVIERVDARDVVIASEQQEMVWCATSDDGLWKVLLDEQAGAIASKMSAEDGLPSQSAFAILPARRASGREASSAESRGEETLWIATARGLARYEPGHIPPAIAATRVMGKRLYTAEELGAGINLDYPQTSLALDVSAASSRCFPEQFQYAFSVLNDEGKQVAERLTRDSQLVIENLRAGRYRVTTRAFTNDLVASEPLSFGFQVAGAPFPWTQAALSALLILALAALWWGSRQNRRLSTTNQQLTATRLELANETERERRRIARDLHDQTLADLRRLMMLSDDLSSGSNGHSSALTGTSSLRDEIEAVSVEVRRICEDLSPSALSNVGLAAALEWALADAVSHLPAEKRFESNFVCAEELDEKLRLSPAAQIQIYRIAQEAITNVCKHSSATKVSLSVAIPADGGFLLELEDNGRGFDPASKAARVGRGLANIRSRASLIEARVTWATTREGGGVFTLRKLAVSESQQA